MSGPITLGAEPSQDDIARAVRRLVGAQRGYEDFGYFTTETWDHIDPATQGVDTHYMRGWETSEATVGRLWDFVINGQTALQGNNAGVFSEMPLSIDNQGDFTGPVTVGSDLTVGGDTDLAGNLLVALQSVLSGDVLAEANFEVDLNTLLHGLLTAEAAATFEALAQFDLGFEVGASAIVVNAAGDIDVGGGKILIDSATGELVMLGDLDVGGSLLLVDVTNDELSFDADLLILDGIARTVQIGALPNIFVDDAVDRVGFGTATPQAGFDFVHASLPTRFSGTGAPASGGGLEVHYSPGTNTATLLSGVRSGGPFAFGSLNINALQANLQASSVIKFAFGAGGISFFGGALAPQQVGGAATADLAYSANERDMLNTLWTMARAYSLLT